MRVLVTGAAGSIGRVLLPGLADRGHEVVGLDRVPPPDGTRAPGTPSTAPTPTRSPRSSPTSRLDAVVHLAGHPGEASLPDSLTSHVVTTAALLDAMVEHDVTPAGLRRLQPRGRPHPAHRGCSTTDVRPRPDTFYGVGKVAAEALLSLYADRYGLDAVSCRIGSFLPEPETTRHLSTWLSHDDCVRMVDAALTATGPRLRGALRHLRQHPRLVGPRAGPGARLRAAGRRRGVRRPDARRARGRRAEAAHVGGPYATDGVRAGRPSTAPEGRARLRRPGARRTAA